MGVITLPARQIPYANCLIDLLIGGPDLLIQSLTGIAAGIIWDTMRDMPRAGRVSPTHRRIAAALTPVFSTPTFFQQLFSPRGLQRTSFGYAGRTTGRSTSWAPWVSRGQTVGRVSSGANARPDREALAAAAQARMKK